MGYPQSRRILREYFSDILYIDDEFDNGLIDIGENIVNDEEAADNMPLDVMPVGILDEGPLLGEKEPEENPGKESPALSLMNLLEKLNREEFADLSFRPVIYDGTISDDDIIAKMRKAHLTIIDWDLGHGKKALPIVRDMMERTEQLKVIVVYTKGFPQAVNSAEELFEGAKCVNDDKHIKCLQLRNKSLIFIMDRMFLSIRTILDEVENIFLKENGIMPVAVLDIESKFQQKIGGIFSSFCKPFEDIYFLQMFYSEVADGELPDYLSDFIIRKIYSDVHIDEKLGLELLESKKDALVEILRSENIQMLADKVVNVLEENLPQEGHFMLEIQKTVKKDTYAQIAHNLGKKENCSWNDVISAFRPMSNEMKKEYIRRGMLEFLGENPERLKENYQDIYRRISDEIKKKAVEEINVYKKNVMPLFLQMLITDEKLLASLPELVENLKYHKYKEPRLETHLRDGIGLESYAKSKFLMNKIHFGDILFGLEQDGYLLCITPPCDSFRPQKTDYKYTFVKGYRIKAEGMEKAQKENIHITAYPFEKSADGKIETIYIKWNLFELVTIDLNDAMQYEKLCGCKRVYRLDEIYTRQIANKFISHFSRAGVDEIFVKNEKSLMPLFS